MKGYCPYITGSQKPNYNKDYIKTFKIDFFLSLFNDMLQQVLDVLGHTASLPFPKDRLMSLPLPTAYNLTRMVNSGAHPHLQSRRGEHMTLRMANRDSPRTMYLEQNPRIPAVVPNRHSPVTTSEIFLQLVGSFLLQPPHWS